MGYEVFEFAKTTINIMQTIIVVDNFRLALAELCSSTTHFDRKPSSCVVKVGRLFCSGLEKSPFGVFHDF